MGRATDLGVLASGQWQQLQDLADRFEKAWHERTDVDVIEFRAFLPPADDPLRTVALHELIKTDLEIRWRRGNSPRVESYLADYPELGTVESLPAALIYEEYRVRHLYGDKPPLSLYYTRFPAQYAEIERLLQEQPVATVSNAAAAPATLMAPGQTPAAAPAPSTPAASPSQPQIPEVGGGYKLIKFLGRGGFG